MNLNDQVTVVIPTFNGGDNLLRCLESLAKQDSRNFDILLVDNASTDDSIARAEGFWKNNHHPAPIRTIQEPKQGAQHARWAGALAAENEILVLCDDDNLLRKDYIKIAADLIRSDSKIGLIGGFGVATAHSDAPFPIWFQNVQAYYACPGIPNESVEMEQISGTYTAGMVARKAVFKRLNEHGFHPLLGGRQGKSLVAGEDIELCKAAALAGYRTVRDSRLIFDHIIPSGRVTVPYLRRLSYAMGVARSRHRAYDYFLDPKLQPFQARAWQHEIRRVGKPFAKSVLSLLRSRVPEKVEVRVTIAYFYTILLGRKSFIEGINSVRRLAQNLNSQKNDNHLEND